MSSLVENNLEVLQPVDMLWRFVNHLTDWNDNPDKVYLVIKKIERLKDHKIYGSFVKIFRVVDDYYKRNGKFPDINWIQTCFDVTMLQVLINVPFSEEIYTDILKGLDGALLKTNLAKILENPAPTKEDYLYLQKELANYTTRVDDEPFETKEDILNIQDKFQENMNGVVKTCMPLLDDTIGILGYKSLCAVAGASGSGKSTFAVSVAYNIAVNLGLSVHYVSYEVPREQIWQNIASLHSRKINKPVEAYIFKEGSANDEQRAIYRESLEDLFAKLNESGGYIHVIDQTSTQCSTFEEFKAKLELEAEKHKRKADLIIIDNIDNLQVLKGGERDETTRVNNYIIQLDAFSKTYYNNEGTCIMMLTQVNRTGLKKMSTDNENGDSGRTKVTLDVTCIQKFNAIYEKATCVLALYANKSLRSSGFCHVYPLKLRYRPLPEGCVELNAAYGYSCIGEGEVVIPSENSARKELEDLENNFVVDAEMDISDDDFDIDV